MNTKVPMIAMTSTATRIVNGKEVVPVLAARGIGYKPVSPYSILRKQS